MIKTFLDSGVLLDAWKGSERHSARALSIMDDSRREFLTSQIVRLELLPKATFHQQRLERSFYAAHFSKNKSDEPLSRSLGDEAFALAAKHNLNAADALNIAAALRMKVDEFFTTETPGKPLYKVPGLKIIYSRSEE